MGWDGDTVRDDNTGENFNPPTPCGVGRAFPYRLQADAAFQSTHPVWGGTTAPLRRIWYAVFQSTHPVWGGTDAPGRHTGLPVISIHPPRVGWDLCGASFLSARWGISIHPPRVGWDQMRLWVVQETRNFNPPTPCGVGRYTPRSAARPGNFNPPTPCGVGPPSTSRTRDL